MAMLRQRALANRVGRMRTPISRRQEAKTFPDSHPMPFPYFGDPAGMEATRHHSLGLTWMSGWRTRACGRRVLAFSGHRYRQLYGLIQGQRMADIPLPL